MSLTRAYKKKVRKTMRARSLRSTPCFPIPINKTKPNSGLAYQFFVSRLARICVCFIEGIGSEVWPATAFVTCL